MDLKAVGQRIKSAREAKNLTQEELAALVNLSPTHVSVIERGLESYKVGYLC
ncbi:MAG: helix-turn-helix domain-containing protein [Blautia faecis]